MMAKPNAIPARLIPSPNKTWLAPQAVPAAHTQNRINGSLDRYRSGTRGMVAVVSNKGKIKRATKDQAIQIFSQAQLRVHFIGTAKLPFITPAARTSAKPNQVEAFIHGADFWLPATPGCFIVNLNVLISNGRISNVKLSWSV